MLSSACLLWAWSALLKTFMIGMNKMPKKTPKKLPKKKLLEKECLSLWSQCVRERDKVCRNSGSDEHLSAHQIRSVTHHSTKYNINNGLCLCWRKCHFLQKHHPERFQDMVLEIIGDEEYARLKAMSLTDIQKHTVYDLEGIKEYLQNELRRLKRE